jgi:hypothetical protein
MKCKLCVVIRIWTRPSEINSEQKRTRAKERVRQTNAILTRGFSLPSALLCIFCKIQPFFIRINWFYYWIHSTVDSPVIIARCHYVPLPLRLDSGNRIADFYSFCRLLWVWERIPDCNIASAGNIDLQYRVLLYELSPEMWLFVRVGIACTHTFQLILCYFKPVLAFVFNYYRYICTVVNFITQNRTVK